ncbi:hypothetical protein CF138_17335 [Aeromonas hydrophila]|uniref:hypothetical protein n=1 Tax=Aeromonas hydrophila TaxID=644 RepID=UPI0011172138|nr:hypothetical protein [Aeromonas hydrophila]TNH82864.1 hypothetical protein CF138_17335 [Aeromonas hydrophila]TNI00249.1 hypothetical protein CF136_10640 [Aeromonas hydrophila]TNI92870.1 hypothetical protein CF118_18000 [Aeromonas hydrophila]
MAKGAPTYNAGSVAVSFTANTANFVHGTQQISKAAKLANAAVHLAGTGIVKSMHVAGVGLKAASSGIVQDLKGIGTAAADAMKASLTPSSWLKALTAGAAGVSLYTGIVVQQRLEMGKLQTQFGLTAREANAFALVAKRVGVETEAIMDAMLQLNVKARDKAEAGTAGSLDRMKAFMNDMGGVAKWLHAGNLDKLIMAREAINKVIDEKGLAEATDLLDDMGESATQLLAVAKLTNTEFHSLLAEGLATAVDVTPIKEMIGKFSVLKHTFDSVLTGIITKMSPIFSMVIDDWTTRLFAVFEGEGQGKGMQAGFESYVQSKANMIFDWVESAILSLASFLDNLNKFQAKALSAYNESTTRKKLGLPMYSNVDTSKLNTSDANIVNTYNNKQEQLSTAEANMRINMDAQKSLEAQDNSLLRSSPEMAAQHQRLVNERSILNDQISTLKNELDPLESKVAAIIDKQMILAKDNNEYTDKARDAIRSINEARLEQQLNPQNLGGNDETNKPTTGQSYAEQVGAQADAAAAKSKADALAASNKAYLEKKEEFYKKLLELQEKFSSEQQSAWQRTVNSERQELNDAFRDIQKERIEQYEKLLADKKKGSAEYNRIVQESLAENKKLETEHDRAMEILANQQALRRQKAADDIMRNLRLQHDEVMRSMGAGGASSITSGKAGILEQGKVEEKNINNKWDEEVRAQTDAGTLTNEKMKELEAMREAELQAHLDRMNQMYKAHGDTAVDTVSRMTDAVTNLNMDGFKQRESVLKGTTNAEIEQAGQSKDAQIAMGKQLGGQIFEQGAQHNKKMFEMNKKMKIADAVMNTYAAVNATMAAWPFPANAIFGALALTQGLMNVAMIKSQKWSGQAHDGWTKIPNTGTYNLEKGERVLSKDLNADMTGFLDANKDTKFGSSGGVTVHSTLQIMGNMINNTDYENDLIARNSSTIARAVENSQRERGVR